MDFFWTLNGLGIALHFKVTFPLVTAVIYLLADGEIQALACYCHFMHFFPFNKEKNILEINCYSWRKIA